MSGVQANPVCAVLGCVRVAVIVYSVTAIADRNELKLAGSNTSVTIVAVAFAVGVTIMVVVDTVGAGINVAEAGCGIVWTAILPLAIGARGSRGAIALSVIAKETDDVGAAGLRRR